MTDNRELKDEVCIFNEKSIKSDLCKYNNSSVWVLDKQKDEYKADDGIFKTMWKIKFYDGRIADVFADELEIDE